MNSTGANGFLKNTVKGIIYFMVTKQTLGETFVYSPPKQKQELWKQKDKLVKLNCDKVEQLNCLRVILLYWMVKGRCYCPNTK